MAGPALLLVSHGSRDPRHAATVRALAERIRRGRPGVTVTTAFLEFDAPGVAGALAELRRAGAGAAVAVPLLLTRAYHAKTDLPAALADAEGPAVRRAAVLGGSPLLLRAVERRLFEAGLTPADRSTTGIVLSGAGSRDPEAIESVGAAARELRRAGWRAVRPAFVTGPTPRPGDVVRELRARGVRRVAVAPYVLAPGLLPDRIAAEAAAARADILSTPLGDTPELARLVTERWLEAHAPLPAPVG
ncbi:sirohydrochlorin chelatase [Streptomyces edwardsiae]|uniref:Sirohydrochlorin chelatase n=1 Tax=Streptomyces edwardsiae TaxID=3075527 RepID=A0ABU2PZR6_9ACTN|nr:sirohydrochlorin chelatase [Streptomyces sp. DSM 41636]MDT0397291.1 sirohydrochlorin chelatase [Streptomyces sp. DSM 41636]